MSVKNIDEKYRCNICGNEVVVTKVGGGVLVCCGQEMEIVSAEETEEIEV
jgi:desulfoferrodoxin-like iron-binding protein